MTLREESRRKRRSRPGWRQVLRVAHRWIGLTLGILVLAVALSGGLLIFKEPYYQSRFPTLAKSIQANSVSDYAQALESVHAEYSDQGIRLIKFPRPGMNAFHLWMADGSQLLLDSKGERVLSRWRWYESLPAFLFELHAHLLAGRTGAVVNGVGGILLLLLLLTSPLLWWPRRSLFQLWQLLPRKASVRELISLHETIGLIVLPFTLLFVATGTAMIFFPSVSSSLSYLFDSKPPLKPTAVVRYEARGTVGWARLLDSLESALPDGDTIFYYPGDESNAVLTFRKKLPGEWHPNGRSYVLIDPYIGEVVQSIDARRQGLGTRMSNTIYPLHAAMVGGDWFRLIALLTALSLAALSLSGGYAYFLRVRRGMKANP